MKASQKPSLNSQLPDRALELIGSQTEGMLQSELRKHLQIESSKCSRIVSKLQRSGLIRRDKISANGHRTYLITLASPPSRKNSFLYRPIDTYLTEIYLLYLMRCSTS